MGETFEFKIISIDPQQHRLGLSYKRLNEPAGEEAKASTAGEKKKTSKKAPKKKLIDEIEETA